MKAVLGRSGWCLQGQRNRLRDNTIKDARRVKARKLQPIEKAQVGMLRRYARLLCGLTGDEAGGGLSQVHGTAQAIAGNAAAVTAKNAHKRTF